MQSAKAEDANCVIESIRSLGEAEYLKAHGATIWAIDADRKIRYDRVQTRWSETDKIDFETFCMHEDREAHGTEAWDMNVQGVMKMADHILYNNGTTNELFAQVERILKGVQ
jgi:dephospho-CoA kinase